MPDPAKPHQTAPQNHWKEQHAAQSADLSAFTAPCHAVPGPAPQNRTTTSLTKPNPALPKNHWEGQNPA
ncbi:MAG: hypothetical protein EB072_18780, partial [Betaproteobacteria bacterium]|nr:hypothetical protein [Betaproteobacteria bacterium]